MGATLVGQKCGELRQSKLNTTQFKKKNEKKKSNIHKTFGLTCVKVHKLQVSNYHPLVERIVKVCMLIQPQEQDTIKILGTRALHWVKKWLPNEFHSLLHIQVKQLQLGCVNLGLGVSPIVKRRWDSCQLGFIFLLSERVLGITIRF